MRSKTFILSSTAHPPSRDGVSERARGVRTAVFGCDRTDKREENKYGRRLDVCSTAPYATVPLHPPADDRGIAPAGGVRQGGAGHKTVPQPAAREQKLLVPGQAKDTKAAEERAETDSAALADAKVNVGNLILDDATPAEISNAKHATNIAQEKAENATRDNVIAQREHKEDRFVILQQANTELAAAERDVRDNPNPTPSTLAKLNAAADNVLRASKDYDESGASLVHAEEMLHAVAGVPMPDGLFTEAVTVNYPSVVIAKGKFSKAVDRLNSGEHQDVKQNLAQVQKAAAELRAAWALARLDARGNTALQLTCDQGFAVAEQYFQDVNNPDFVKAQESR